MEELPFPSTPEEMEHMLLIERMMKAEGRLTSEGGAFGYIMMTSARGHEIPLSLRHLMALGPNGQVALRVVREQ